MKTFSKKFGNGAYDGPMRSRPFILHDQQPIKS